MWTKESEYNRYFSHCCDHTPEPLREEQPISMPIQRTHSGREGCDRILSVEAGGGLLTTLQSMKPRETKRGSDDSSFPLLDESQIPGHQLVPSTFKVSLSSLVILSGSTLRDRYRCVPCDHKSSHMAIMISGHCDWSKFMKLSLIDSAIGLDLCITSSSLTLFAAHVNTSLSPFLSLSL